MGNKIETNTCCDDSGTTTADVKQLRMLPVRFRAASCQIEWDCVSIQTVHLPTQVGNEPTYSAVKATPLMKRLEDADDDIYISRWQAEAI